MTEDDLKAIEARCNAATEGPWYRKTPNTAVVSKCGGNIEWEIVSMGSVSDHEFIAHARQDIPALIAEVRRLREEVESRRDWHGRMQTAFAEAMEKTGQKEIAGLYQRFTQP